MTAIAGRFIALSRDADKLKKKAPPVVRGLPARDGRGWGKPGEGYSVRVISITPERSKAVEPVPALRTWT